MRNFSSFMLDIETLGKIPGAAIVQIGVCPFDLNNLTVGQPKKWNVTPAADATYDFDTIAWWMQQSDAARKSVFAGEHELPGPALGQLNAYLRMMCPRDGDFQVWALPPSFDVSLLEALYRQVGHVPAWKYNAPRCLRTLNELAGIEKKDRVQARVEHDAGADAEAQARTAINAVLKHKEASGSIVRYVECVLPDGVSGWRPVDYAVRGEDGPPQEYPVLLSAEQVVWVVGDVRPHIVGVV